MSLKIRKIFSLLFKRKIFLSVLFFVLFGLFFLPRPTLAAWYDFLIGAVTFVPNVFISLIVYLIVMLTSLLAAFGGVMLSWVLSPSFTSLSYTNPANNEVIRIGLSITQGFVNMFLVLVLVYIAIATILRLAGYETKKLLVTFILIALLVNFAPVVCGLIVDASNIVMNFFIKELTGSKQLINDLKAFTDVILASFGSWEVFKVTKQTEIIFTLLVLIVVNILLFFVLLLFALVFLFRYIVIWILVILSPLAFACYILPATRKYWSMWWNQLIHWSIIGIVCGFFLYLAEQLAALGPQEFALATGLGSRFLPHIVPIAFLFIGLVFGLQTSAMGATGIINLAKRGGKYSGKWAARKGLEGVGRYIQESSRLKEATGKVVKKVEKVPVARWFLPEAIKKYGEFAPAIEKDQAKAKPFSSQTLARRVRTGAAIGTEAVGDILEFVTRGDSEDLFNSYREEKWAKKFKAEHGRKMTTEEIMQRPEFKKRIKRLLQIAKGGGKLNDIIRRAPRLASLLSGEKWAPDDYTKLSPEDAVRKATSEAKSQHVRDWEKEEIDFPSTGDPALWVIETWMEKGRGEWTSLESVTEGQRTAQNTIDEIFTKWVKKNRSDLATTLERAIEAGDEKLIKQTENYISGLWDTEFKRDFKQRHKDAEGYFQALGYKGFQARGWKPGQFKKPGVPEPPPTTAEAAGVPPETGAGVEREKKKRKKGPPGPPETGAGI